MWNHALLLVSILAPIADFLTTLRFRKGRVEVGLLAGRLAHMAGLERAAGASMVLGCVLILAAVYIRSPYAIGFLAGAFYGSALRNYLGRKR